MERLGFFVGKAKENSVPDEGKIGHNHESSLSWSQRS